MRLVPCVELGAYHINFNGSCHNRCCQGQDKEPIQLLEDVASVAKWYRMGSDSDTEPVEVCDRARV